MKHFFSFRIFFMMILVIFVILLVSFVIQFVTYHYSTEKYLRIVKTVETNGFLEPAIITLTNGQIIHREPGWVSLMELKSGDTIQVFENQDIPGMISMEIRTIDEVVDSSNNIYWIANFVPVDQVGYFNHVQVLYFQKPKVKTKMIFQLSYGSMGEPAGYKPAESNFK